ncbi:MAG: T9SS type A sorting domain-containing protein [Candidatus Fermentibacteraceae bacterium]
MRSSITVLVLICWTAAALPCFMELWGGEGDDGGRSLLALDDGYLMAGHAEAGPAGDLQAWVLQLDVAGDSVDSRLYGAPDLDEYCLDICSLQDGSYALTGSAADASGGYDLWAAGLDPSLDTLWRTVIESPGDDAGYSVIEHPDGGVLVAGSRSVSGSTGYAWLLRFDSCGDTLWTVTSGSGPLRLFYDLEDAGDGLVGAGLDCPGGGDSDMWLAFMDYDGQMLWDSSYGGPGWEVCYGLALTAQGFALGGYTTSCGSGDGDFWLLQTDPDGDSLTAACYGGGEWERCHDLLALDDGFLLCGYTRSYLGGESDLGDGWMVRTYQDGSLCWSEVHGSGGTDYLWSVLSCEDGGFALTGSSTLEGNGQLLALRVDSLGQIPPSATNGTNAAASGSLSLEVAANPVRAGGTMVLDVDAGDGQGRLEVYDGSGRLMAAGLVSGRETLSISSDARGRRLPAGVYLLRLTASGRSVCRRAALLAP